MNKTCGLPNGSSRLRTRLLTTALCCGAVGPPLMAEVDLSGYWQPDAAQDQGIRGGGPDTDAFMGVPLSAQARAAGLSWSPESRDQLWRTCEPYSANYLLVGPFGFNISPDTRADGYVVAWNISATIDRDPTVIWMDGRQGSSLALHTPAGFTTGRWEGDTLITTTTQIQDNMLYRNGVPNSNQEVMTMYMTRHDNLLSITGIMQDPVYLTAPYVLTGIWWNDPSYRWFDPERKDSTCTPEESGSGGGIDAVPSYLSPAPDALMYETTHYGIPQDAVAGGAQTMYPEYAKRIQKEYIRPKPVEARGGP